MDHHQVPCHIHQPDFYTGKSHHSLQHNTHTTTTPSLPTPTLRHQTSWEHIHDHQRAYKLKKLTNDYPSPWLPAIHEFPLQPPSYDAVMNELKQEATPEYSFFHVKSSFKCSHQTHALPRYVEGKDSLLGSFYFDNMETATCCIKIQGGQKYWIHSHYVSPISAYFRDAFNPRHESHSLFIKLDVFDHSYYRLIDTPISKDVARFRFETQKMIQKVCHEILGPQASRRHNPQNSIGFKRDFFEHLKQYKTHTLIKNLERKGYYAQGTFKPSSDPVYQPILSLQVPHPYLFGMLLKWMYTRHNQDLFDEIDRVAEKYQDRIRTCRHIFHLIELANYLKLAPCFYSALAYYFRDRGELTLSRRFHHSLVPLSLMNTFMSITNGWEENDRLAVILWWSRSANDDLRLKVRQTTLDLDDDEFFKVEVKRLSTCCTCFSSSSTASCPLIHKQVIEGILTTFIQFHRVDERYCAELLDLLPETFEKAMKLVYS